MILINPVGKKEYDYSDVTVLPNVTKLKYRSIADMVNSIEFRINEKYKGIDLESLNLTNEYNYNEIVELKKKINIKEEKLEVKEVNVKNVIKENKSFSKRTNKLINRDDYNAMKLGTDIHEYLEFIDLKNPNYDLIDNKLCLNIIKNLLDQELLRDISKAKIYQEYEFIYEDEGIKYHGVIDLMLEYDDYIDIIDYKLKNTIDEDYKRQLKGYYNYIKFKTDKRINLYLYSLLEHRFYQINY